MPTRERRSCTSAGRCWATCFERDAEFGDGFVLLAGAGFLPEAGEGSGQQALDLGIGFLRQFLADHGDGIGHDFIGRAGDRGRRVEPARLRFCGAGPASLASRPAAVVGENFGGELIIVALKKDFDELANVAGRHAGGFAGEQNALLAGFGNLSPEHAVENVGMRLDQNAGLRHLIFLDAQDLAERVHLPAHVLHHVVDGVDLDIAALIAVEGELDGHALGGLHQQRSVIAVAGAVLGSLRRQTVRAIARD